MTKRSDFELIKLSKQGDSKAQMELWNKWKSFTSRQFKKASETYSATQYSYEDYMQDAFVAFLTAIDRYDINKAEAAGSSNFSTFYYFYLMKLKNAQDDQLNKFGVMLYQSDFEVNSSDENIKNDSTNTPWVRAISRDIGDDFIKDEVVQIFEKYFEEEQSPLLKKIVQMRLQGMNAGKIQHAFKDTISYNRIRKLIDEAYAKIRMIAEAVIYEPISSQV